MNDTQNNYYSQKQKFINDTINKLSQPNNTFTTLEVKTALRNDYPHFFWTQQEVSDEMKNMEMRGELIITDDNGTYRTYAMPTYVAPNTTTNNMTKSIKAVKVKRTPVTHKITKHKALELMENNGKGKFFSVTFTKNDNSERTLTGRYYSTDSLGYLKLKTNTNEIKNVNLQTISTIRMLGDIYNVG